METDSEQLEELTPTGESDETTTPLSLFPPVYRQDLTVNYLGGLFLASIALLFVSALGVMSWWVTIPVIGVLITTLFEGWRNVTLIIGGVMAAIMVLSFMSSIGQSSASEQLSPTPTQPLADPFPPVEGSLGIYVDQVSDLWNTVDGPPRIQRGLTHQTEPGEYDAFIYRFGEWGRLIGAYDDDSKAIYALLGTGQLGGVATDQLYIHLCFVVAPFSQECLDNYQEKGLGGGTLDEFVDVSHQANWSLGEHSWHLQIDQNVLSIRVYGEDVP